MKANGVRPQPSGLSKLLIACWSVAALVGLVVVVLGARPSPADSSPQASPLSEGRVALDGRLEAHFSLGALQWIHEGTRVNFRWHPIGRVVEVDPGRDSLLVKMVIRRNFVGKTNAAITTLKSYDVPSAPWGTMLAFGWS